MSQLKELTRRKVDRGRIVGVRIAIMGGRSGSGAASAILCDYARFCQNRDSGDQNRVHNRSHNRVRNRAESCTLTTPIDKPCHCSWRKHRSLRHRSLAHVVPSHCRRRAAPVPQGPVCDHISAAIGVQHTCTHVLILVQT